MGIPNAFVTFGKKLFKISAVSLSLQRILSFLTEIVFPFVILLLESIGLRVFQNFPFSKMFFSLRLLKLFRFAFFNKNIQEFAFFVCVSDFVLF